ncbi:beta-lactamase-like protein [Multifurca ochricompacta]|uniref:Beta-lactamase-like protein n=1 Tax=Multifurca ochricompacta TaxID=376703 RepID=A0AAD4MEJ4_9AGAM|nr:beta-lactamase-like protein [Multifurca ochricompacta]
MSDSSSHVVRPTSGIEFIFLGTGTSGSLPNVSCLTALENDVPCKTCLSTLKPEGKKNIRRNTSAVMRIEGKDGKKRTIVIDVGKNFQAAAVEWFPKYGLRRIDAVLITHAHADAMNGLDDLRGWTLRGAIQKFIDVYASRATFAEVERAFPYMVSREFASGGGDIPEFKWHIFENKEPIDVADSGIIITPFEVQHGRLWATSAPPAFSPTPATTTPSTPTQTPSTLKSDPSASLLAPPVAAIPSPRRPLASANHGQGVPELYPYLCHAFRIQDSIIYLSDASWISEESWAVLNQPSIGNPLHQYAVAIVDCLRPMAHISHYGIREAVNVARRINARRTYLTGFGHEVSHEEYVRIGEYVGGKVIDKPTMKEKYCIDLVDEGRNIWLRPSHDGLRVQVSGEGEGELEVKDNSYDDEW